MSVEKVAAAIERALAERAYGLYDYSGYPGEADPHVVRDERAGTVLLRTNDPGTARKVYDELVRTHPAIAAIQAMPPLPREQQPGLEWRDFNSPGLKQQSLYFNGRSIGMVQKYGFEDQWLMHFQGDFAKFDTEAEARQALWDAATEWLSPSSNGKEG